MAKKEAFGGKQAKPFGKGKAEQEKKTASKGRERQDPGKDTK